MSAPGAPMGGNPDELLMQIRQLLDQYLAMGEGTPVAQEAAMLAQAIDGAAGGGAPPEGGMPPEGGLPPEAMAMAGGAPPEGAPDEATMMMSGEEPVPDMAGMPGGEFGSFPEATAALEEDMKKKLMSKGR